MSSQEFSRLLLAEYPRLDERTREQIVKFREQVLEENARQNLTRILDPRAFIDGHLVDAIALRELGLAKGVLMDLGSGAGVPGVLLAILEPESRWILVDSEKKKADFLGQVVQALELKNARAVGERAEAVLKEAVVDAIVARAVGPVERIYGWIRKCSTWNTLILLKGPAWDEEWAEFSRGKWKNELKIEKIHDYTVGADGKKRKIVVLSRQDNRPRST